VLVVKLPRLVRFFRAPALLVLCAPWSTGNVESPAERALSFAPAETRPAAAKPTPELERARALEKARDWPGLVEFLGQRALRVELAPEEERLYAAALEQVGRIDEAAHHMDSCATANERLGRDNEQKAALASLRRLDPLSARRDPFVRKVTSTLLTAVEELLAGGDAERALRIAQGLPRIARGKETRAAADLLARARAAFEKVELARPDDSGNPTRGANSAIERETTHYKLVCHLEPEVVERLGKLMDDVHAFYVRVYFDGDAKRLRGSKATIKIAPDRETMLADWSGPGEPEGWWSPGENAVHAYDTRGSTGSLDWMLETLFHEASHQFMTLLAGGSSVPAWLNEGTSSFFEGTVAMADGRVLWPRAAEKRLQALLFQMQSGKAPTLRDVVEYDQPGSYAAEYYAWGWGLVYFLQEYEDPATLEHVYRPLYAKYRDTVIKKGGASFELFEEVFLGDDAPRKLPDFSSLEREWIAWIRGEVAPLHGRNAKARELRLARIERLVAAADAAEKKKGGADVEDLLSRALVHFEWVRTQIDKAKPDAELSLRQADVFERLGRASAAAALIEEVLDEAERGTFVLDDAGRANLEKRLSKLDRKNAALRVARQRTVELARAGLALVADYRESGLTLRAATLAADLAAVLGEPLEPVAAELRSEARAKGLLVGSIRALAAGAGAWQPLLSSPMESFVPGATSVLIESVRAGVMVDTSLEAEGEYVVRAELRPEGSRGMGWTAGLVVAGAPERAATLVGIDDRGLGGIWTLNAASRGAATMRRTRTIAISPPVPAGETVELAVRVRIDGALEIRVGDRPTVEARIELAPDGTRHVGLFVKNARVRFFDPRLELVP